MSLTSGSTTTVVVLATGGTIDKGYPKSKLGYAFEIGDRPAVQSILNNVTLHPSMVNITVEQVLRKDSTDITSEDRTLLGRHVEQWAVQRMVKRFLVTHGTDTMVETCSFLDPVAVRLEVFVVICGSKLPEAFKESDASFNVGFALGALSMLQVPGCYLCMNGCVWRAGTVKYSADGAIWETK